MKNIQLVSTVKDGFMAEMNPLNGQIVSLKLKGVEYMHGGGRAEDDPAKTALDRLAWPTNSWTKMWPIVSSSENNEIRYHNLSCPLDQHGLVRLLPPKIIIPENTQDAVLVVRKYRAFTPIDNFAKHIKNPDTSPIQTWLPFSFSVEEAYKLEDVLKLATTYTNKSSLAICFAAGDHPGFINRSPVALAYFVDAKTGLEVISLKDLRDRRSYVVDGGDVIYRDENKGGVRIKSDYGQTMLCSPADHLFWMEPITEKRPTGSPINLSENGSYKSKLLSRGQKTHNLEIEILNGL